MVFGMNLWLLIFDISMVTCATIVQQDTTLKFKSSHTVQCHEDPETRMNVTQLITSKGFPCEDYTVQTEDGFLLSIQRIPHGRGGAVLSPGQRPVVFLQHGLLCSSANWLTNLVNQSLGFLLADAGFDVWLGNMRGNTYSRKHVKLSPDSDEFWSWSWDEMARYDLPAMLNFILKKTGQKQLYYVGHSQGTLIAFAQFSRDQELAKKVKTFFALGPVITAGKIISPLRYLSYLAPEIRALVDLLGVREFLPNDSLMKFLAGTLCKDELTHDLCSNVFFILCGYDPQQLNMTRLPVYISHTPAGTSVQNIVHFSQMVRSGKFQMYDYGCSEENKKHYGQITPPLYNVENMHTPTVLFWADNDWLADPQDVKSLKQKLPNLVSDFEIHAYDHLDFIWAMNAPNIIYRKIIKMIKEDQQPN